ncbi:MAG: putative polysaccharide export protein [Nitrospira sp. OLB3]|nr:MAG: putative polysaccharide export protein [Nitrospira sp. OLB3]
MGTRVISCWLAVLLLVLTTWHAVAGETKGPPAGYRIGPNDVIRIQVFGEEDLSVEARVSGDGKLDYPLLGVLQVGGKTTQDLQALLTKRLSAGYVRSPKVTVSIARHRNVYVSGEVKTPGGFPFEDGLTAQKAVTMAGGFTDKAVRNGLTITRRSEGHEQTFNAPLTTPLLPDDMLVVAQLQKFYLMGEVMRPGPYPFEEQLTAKKAVSFGGGYTDKADKKTLKVTRVTESGAQTIAIGPDDLILPSDILAVGSHNYKVYISGEVRAPGAYPYSENISLQKALTLAGGVTEKADRKEMTVRRVVGGQEQTLVLPLEAAVQPEDLIVVREGQKVYVTGEVKTPGRYAYEAGATVQRVLTLAGGVTEKAEASVVKLTRTTAEGVETTVVALDAAVVPEDIILVVPKSDRFYVSGEVKNPGGYAHKEGLSLQKALAMAGGATEKGDVERVQVVRIVNHQEEHVAVTLESLVLPEDTIVVAERQKVYVTGEVRTRGGIRMRRGCRCRRR